MIFKRKEYEIKQGNGNIVHKVVIQSTLCPKGSHESEVVQLELLKQIAQVPALTVCGGHLFQTLTMKHLDDRWIIEIQSLEEVIPST